VLAEEGTKRGGGKRGGKKQCLKPRASLIEKKNSSHRIFRCNCQIGRERLHYDKEKRTEAGREGNRKGTATGKVLWSLYKKTRQEERKEAKNSPQKTSKKLSSKEPAWGKAT